MNSTEERIRELEQQLEESKEFIFQLAKLAEMGKQVAIVAHELSQPLLGIKAFAQILQRRYPGDEFIEPKVELIVQQAKVMEDILDGLRQFARQQEFKSSKTDMQKPVKAAISLYEDRARKMKVPIKLETSEELPLVKCNQGHLQQVTANLIGNALDELEDAGGGELVIRLDVIPNSVRMRLVDSGGGVSDDVRERIFEPFFTTKTPDRGTGLGMFISKDILDRYGGSIRLMEPDEVEREFGEGLGAAFEVLLVTAEPDDDEAD